MEEVFRMKNLFEAARVEEVKERVAQLRPDSERLWGTFKPVIGKEEEEGFAGAKSGTAFIVKNADRFFLFAETGDLIIAKLSAAGYEEVSRAKLLDPTSAAFGRKVLWMHPAFAEKCVFARNDKEIVCASLAE